MANTSTPAVTNGSTGQFVGDNVTVGATNGTVGFYGHTPAAQPTSASITDYASLKAALQALGLIGA